MRKILFRGKCKDGIWVYGDLLHDNFGIYIRSVDIDVDDEEVFTRYARDKVIPETVGEYTGLLDKNGQKIFEGDILLVKYSDFVGNDAECRVFLTNMTDFEVMGRIDTANEIEVIGNIHDNPELLGVE